MITKIEVIITRFFVVVVVIVIILSLDVIEGVVFYSNFDILSIVIMFYGLHYKTYIVLD